MNLKGSISQLNPLLKLLVLVVLFRVNMLLFQVLISGLLGEFSSWNTDDYRTVVVLSPIFNFIIPALLFYYLNFQKRGLGSLGFKGSHRMYWLTLIPAFVLIIQSLPIIHNANEQLFDLLGLKDLVLNTSESYNGAIDKIIKGADATGMFLNIIGIALLTAIGEEIVFRGILQKLICNFTKNLHFGILISAFIFSLVHWEFSGFLDRMFLGLIYGYIFVYSGSIFTVMILHFLNNAIGIIGMWYVSDVASKEEVAEISSQADSNAKIIPIVSLLLLSGLMYYFKVNSKEDLSTYLND